MSHFVSAAIRIVPILTLPIVNQETDVLWIKEGFERTSVIVGVSTEVDNFSRVESVAT